MVVGWEVVAALVRVGRVCGAFSRLDASRARGEVWYGVSCHRACLRLFCCSLLWSWGHYLYVRVRHRGCSNFENRLIGIHFERVRI